MNYAKLKDSLVNAGYSVSNIEYNGYPAVEVCYNSFPSFVTTYDEVSESDKFDALMFCAMQALKTCGVEIEGINYR